jgi:hypothetical protein
VYLEFVGDVGARGFDFHLYVFEEIFVLFYIFLLMCIWSLWDVGSWGFDCHLYEFEYIFVLYIY